MFCVGLTGNVGSGKSTAISFFKALGITTISADDISKSLTQPNTLAFQEIVHHFGKKALTSTGLLNRTYLREIIFNDKKERLWLENLLHPLIREAIELEVKQARSVYSVIEIPLLFNREQYPYLNRILVIQAQTKHQLSRIVKRDLCTEEQALAILDIQPCDKERSAIADDIVMNNTTLSDFQDKITMLHEQYLKLARQ